MTATIERINGTEVVKRHLNEAMASLYLRERDGEIVEERLELSAFNVKANEFESDAILTDANAFTKGATASRCVWRDGSEIGYVLNAGIAYLSELRDTIVNMSRGTVKCRYVSPGNGDDKASEILGELSTLDADQIEKRCGAIRHPLYLAIKACQSVVDWHPKSASVSVSRHVSQALVIGSELLAKFRADGKDESKIRANLPIILTARCNDLSDDKIAMVVRQLFETVAVTDDSDEIEGVEW